MSIRAQLMMIMALDKCLGCHACSVSCKRSWTDRPGSEQAWFNNVETRPGLGYPPGWEANEAEGLHPRGRGGSTRAALLGRRSPHQAEDYYEPWTYDFGALTDSALTERPPVARGPLPCRTGGPWKPRRGPNWDDDLAGTRWLDRASRGSGASMSSPVSLPSPSQTAAGESELRLHYQQLFMLYLPRICNHCLNPSCAVACPSKAIYKRSRDGIVLVDQDKCRGKRFCVAACPYKKVYVNRLTNTAEKCMFCLPGVTENGLPALCAENCVGRIRSIGVVLYDSEAVAAAAETDPETDLVEAHRQLLLDPHDVSVLTRAEGDGVPHQWLEAARHSPAYALVKELRVALPLHPEFRTLPMVWYVPPLSPVLDPPPAVDSPTDATDESSRTEKNEDDAPVFGGARQLRIPLHYLAEFFAAGDPAPVEESLDALIATREFKRLQQIHGEDATRAAGEAGIDPDRLDRLFRLLAVSERKERFVIPTARYEDVVLRRPAPTPRPSGRVASEKKRETEPGSSPLASD